MTIVADPADAPIKIINIGIANAFSVTDIKNNPNASLVGIVVNEVNDRAKNTKINSGYNDYYYSYYYASDDDQKTNEVKETFIKRLSKKLLKFLNK